MSTATEPLFWADDLELPPPDDSPAAAPEQPEIRPGQWAFRALPDEIVPDTVIVLAVSDGLAMVLNDNGHPARVPVEELNGPVEGDMWWAEDNLAFAFFFEEDYRAAQAELSA